MENASKALIIAGAILLSILIISLGIMIYNQAAGVVNNNAMTEVEVNSFNQKFEQYMGERVRGANVKALITAVENNNRAEDDESKHVEITGVNDKSAVQTGSTYNVTVPADGTTNGGLIHKINIVVNP